MAKNVHIRNCWTKAINQSYCSRNGILFTAVDGLFLNGNSFRSINSSAIKPYRETPILGYPGSDLPIRNIIIEGGLYEVVTATGGIPLYMSEAATVVNENWVINNAVLKGGSSAIRIEAVGIGGEYRNLNFKFDYIGSNVDDATHDTPVVAGGGIANATINATAPWRQNAYIPTCGNGSIWISPNDGEVRTRTDGLWRRGGKTYTITIANDAVATIVPPMRGTGFIAVTGDGISTHVFGWYRATPSPAASKYYGSASTTMVSTPLTGTAGTVGNVTVGIQDNLIYIENRNGSTNTFKISFL